MTRMSPRGCGYVFTTYIPTDVHIDAHIEPSRYESTPMAPNAHHQKHTPEHAVHELHHHLLKLA